MVHFEGGLLAVPDLSGLSLCAPQLFSQAGWREARRFIGKRRGGRRPARDDQIPSGKTLVLFERVECKHVLIAVKAKVQARFGAQTVQADRMGVQGATQLRDGIQPVKAV